MKQVRKILWFMTALLVVLFCGCSADEMQGYDPGTSAEVTYHEKTVDVSDNDTATVPEERETHFVSDSAAEPWYSMSRLIYHACGIADGVTYTNSREAMDSTLSKGNMLVEVDFLFTTDGHLICGHKWKDIIPVEEEEPKKKNKKKKEEPIPEVKCTLEEFCTLKIKEKFTGLTGTDIISYMQSNPSLYIVVDTKEEDSALVIAELLKLCEYQPEIADRFVIQLYDRGMKEKMMALYPFRNENFLFTCYKFDPLRVEEILDTCREEDIFIVTVPYGSWEQETVNLFLAEGIVLFEHTVNLPEEAAISFQKGIYGIYTDSLQETELIMLNY